MEVLFEACGRRRVTSVLLIQLFVVKAAVGCPKPLPGVNTVLTNSALLLNDFAEGIEVALDCASGYEKESGSGLISCMGGNWTEPDLVCKKKDCGPPPPQPNMKFDTSPGTLFGARIKVSCDKGYEISGSSFKQCFPNGWIGRGTCEIVLCEKPVEVPNGRHSWDSNDDPKYGESVQYVCDSGYTLTGKDAIMCTETGEYDSDPPECKGVTKEDIITTKRPPTPPLAQTEEPTSKDSSTHRPQTHTTSAAPKAPPTTRGGRGIFMAEDTTTSVTPITSSSFQEKLDETLDASSDVGYAPVIVSVCVVTVVVCVLLCILHKSLLRKKGSANRAAPLC